MEDYFEIFGTQIKLSDIKEFRIIQQEYIYRATYKEIQSNNGIMNKIKDMIYEPKKVEFVGMQPYAAIYDENNKGLAISEYKAKDFKESAGKDFVEGIIVKAGEKLNMKTIKSKKYCCINQAGRRFTTYLEDIPAKLLRSEGDESDIKKTDEMYHLIGREIAPSIRIVKALYIKTKKDTYVFYGNDIQLTNVEEDYERLKNDFAKYNTEKKIDLNNVFDNIKSKIKKNKI